MGTYLGYFGGRTIPEDKREEFTRRVLTILDQGGMMDLEEVSMFGKKIYLMKPLQIQPGQETITFCYNYFENDIWETAGYRPGTCRFYTNKVGWRQFDLVCSAVYVLYEFYADSFGMANRNDHVYDVREIIGWLRERNPQIRIVINCIALETLAEITALLQEWEICDVDIASVNIGKAKQLGAYHLMMGQNPVYVISFGGKV